MESVAPTKIKNKANARAKVKSGGQECPPYTGKGKNKGKRKS
jgi:hypothetical protein